MPNLNEIRQITVNSPNHFGVNIDFQLNSEYLEKFKQTLTIYVYKRKNHKLLNSTVEGLLANENIDLQVTNGEININEDFSKLSELDIFKNSISEFERKVYLYESTQKTSINDFELVDNNSSLFSMYNVIDNKVELQQLVSKPKTLDDLWNLKLIFAYSESEIEDMDYISHEYINELKRKIDSIR